MSRPRHTPRHTSKAEAPQTPSFNTALLRGLDLSRLDVRPETGVTRLTVCR
jgi:hypothetical protein